MKISCMIPSYNEEECVVATAQELIHEFKKLKQEFELILVDHGSRDSTLEKIKQLKEQYPALIKVVHHPQNIGYGGIINLGLREYTQGEIVGWTCADGEIKAEDTRKLVEFLLNNHDYAAVKASRINRNKGYRQFISGRYNQLVKALFAINTKDINGWPLFIRSTAYNNLDIRLTNWVINIEILHKLQRQGLNFKDIDCEHQKRRGSKSKVHPLTVLSFLYQIMAYRIQTALKKNKS